MIAVRSCFFLTNQQKAHSMWINSLAYQQACQQRGASVSFLSLKGMIWVLIIQHLTGLNVTTKKQKSYKCGCLYVRLILNTLVYPTRNGSEKRSQLLRTGQWGKKPRFESSWNTRGRMQENLKNLAAEGIFSFLSQSQSRSEACVCEAVCYFSLVDCFWYCYLTQ